MNSGWSVMVACNDWRDGRFIGQARAFDFLAPCGEIALSLQVDQSVRFAVVGHNLVVGKPGKREPFVFTKSSEWHGNWCWNRYWLNDTTTARLLRLCWRGGRPEIGWCDLTEPVERGEPITAKLLRRIVARAS